MNDDIADPGSSRSRRLKAATHAVHDALDTRIMRADIFASRAHFAGFLRAQYRFHRDLDALYADPALAEAIPQLASRRRLLLIANDLGDLRSAVPAAAPGRLDGHASLPTALGWLYVAEGSNLGGAVLSKLAREKLGLANGFGARHLAPHAEGAARHWRQFTAALDAIVLTPAQEAEVVQGAEDAFRTVRGYVEQELPLPDQTQAVVEATPHT